MKRVFFGICWALLICFFLCSFVRPIDSIDVDLGRDLLLGHIIVSQRAVPLNNLLSFVYPTYPFINSSWLSQVLFYVLVKVGGFDLLLVVTAAVAAVAIGIEVMVALRKYAAIPVLFCAAIYLLLLSIRSDVRPEEFSMLCIALYMVVLFRFQEKPSRRIFILIPLQLLFVNLHIYFFMGPLLVLLFLADEYSTSHFVNTKSTKFLFLTFLATAFVSIINPNGLSGALFPLVVLHNYGLPVVENQSIFVLFSLFHTPTILYATGVMVLLFGLLLWGRKNTRPIYWFLSILFSLSFLIVFRNILLFVFTTFIPFCSQADYLFLRYRKAILYYFSKSAFLYYLLVMLFLLSLLGEAFNSHPVGLGVSDTLSKGTSFYLSHNIKGPIFNDFNSGGYLAYRIYPKRVFVDNRPEAYPASFFTNVYNPMQQKPAIFQKLNMNMRFNAVIIEHWDQTAWFSPLEAYMLTDPHFTLVYLDPYMFILLANNTENDALIDQYRISDPMQIIQRQEDPYLLVHYLFLLEKTGQFTKTQTVFKRIQSLDPSLCSLYGYPLTNTYLQKYMSQRRISASCAGSGLGIVSALLNQ